MAEPKNNIKEEFLNGVNLKIKKMKIDEKTLKNMNLDDDGYFKYSVECCGTVHYMEIKYNEDRDKWQGIVNSRSLSFFSMKKDAIQNCKLRIVLEHKNNLSEEIETGIGD